MLATEHAHRNNARSQEAATPTCHACVPVATDHFWDTSVNSMAAVAVAAATGWGKLQLSVARRRLLRRSPTGGEQRMMDDSERKRLQAQLDVEVPLTVTGHS